MSVTHNTLRRMVVVSLGLGLLGFAAQAAGPTIPETFVLPASAADTSKPGFIWRVHQLDGDSGGGNDLADAERQLAGEFGANQASFDWIYTAVAFGEPVDPGNEPMQFELDQVINMNQDDGGTAGNFTPDNGIEGIPGLTGSTDEIVGEVLTWIELPAGEITLGVNSDDGFRLTLGGAAPNDKFGITITEFDGTRGSADSIGTFTTTKAGLYAARVLWFENGGGANLEFFSVKDDGTKVLINDTANGGFKAYRAVTGGGAPIAQSISPQPGSTDGAPDEPVIIELADGGSPLEPGSLVLKVDDTEVTPTVSKSGSVTTVRYDPATLYASGSTHTVEITYGDGATTATQQWDFGVQTYVTLGADDAYAGGDVDRSKPGFVVRVAQAREDAGLPNSSQRAIDQLNGMLIDPNTGQPFENEAIPGTGPDGTYEVTGVINFEQDSLEAGNFTATTGAPDDWIPGIPGLFGHTDQIALEAVTYLELSAGVHTFGVNSDDGFAVLAGRNGQDLFAPALGRYEGGRGAADTLFNFVVEQDGVYSVRLIWYEGGGGASVEFFSVNRETGEKTLINGTGGDAVKAWRAVNADPRPYVKAVSPAPDATRVDAQPQILAKLGGLDGGAVTLKLNGQEVSPQVNTAGGETVVTYTPSTPLGKGEITEVTLGYGGVENSWSFKTATGRDVLLLLNNGTAAAGRASDLAIKAHLEDFWNFDVTEVDDNASQTSDADGMMLIINSSTVSSGQVAGKFQALAIPIINWEQANQDDMLFSGNSGGTDRGTQGGQTEVEIIDDTHPLAAGLANGVYTYVTAPTTVSWGNPAATAHIVARMPSNPDRQLIYYFEKGDTLYDGSAAPERRVHLGILENSTFPTLNETGRALFDAAVGWAINEEVPVSEPPMFDPIALEGGNITLSWQNGGTLQEADSPTGPWTDSANQDNPQTVPADQPMKFFRLAR